MENDNLFEDEVDSKGKRKLVLPIEPHPIRQLDYSFLSPEQIAVVETLGKGIISQEACPGSGKTTVNTITGYSMVQSGVRPSSILMLTFSKNGSSEMRVRIAKLFWDLTDDEIEFFANPDIRTYQSYVDADPIRGMICNNICTIHAICMRILKMLGYKIQVLAGSDKKFDADNLIKDSIKMLGWDESPKIVKSYISKAIVALVVPEKSKSYFAELIVSKGGDGWQSDNLSKIYESYMRFMKSHELVDYDMMQSRVLMLMRKDSSVSKKLQSMYDYIIVDEAQDTSKEQAEIVWNIVKDNLIMVGDCDQTLYKFRSAIPDVLRSKLTDRFAGVNRLTLSYNRRSTKSIVDVASRVIASNYLSEDSKKWKKEYHTQNTDGDKPKAFLFKKFDTLAAHLVETIQTDTADRGGKFGDWYVLSRTRAECSALHLALVDNDIPAINKVGGMIFGGKYIDMVIAYAKLAINYKGARDNVEILSKVANVATKDFVSPMTRRLHRDDCPFKEQYWKDCGCPVILNKGLDKVNSRYIGKATMAKCRDWRGVEILQYERNKGGYDSTSSYGARDFVQFVERLERCETAISLVRTIIEDSVYPYLIHGEGLSGDDLSDNGVEEEFDILLRMINDDMTPEDFLKLIEQKEAKLQDQPDTESVILGTVHWSKGAERKSVYVNATRMPITGVFNDKNKLPSPNEPNTIEDERNIFYVAITRAKENLVISAAAEWNGKEIPVSQFVFETGLIDTTQRNLVIQDSGSIDEDICGTEKEDNIY